MRVLLIDDEPFYFQLIKNKLKEANYELEYARSGPEGLAKIPSFEPELLIIDLKLPEMDGFEILNRLRRDSKYSTVPAIVITAKDELKEKLKAFELGADDYLVKPFQPEELVARMGILARRRKILEVAEKGATGKTRATMVTIHSLRGGLGCSSIAVNLGLAFQKLWEKSTLIIDGVLAAGQVALMLDAKPTATWETIVGVDPELYDDAMMDELMRTHGSGIRYIASPNHPIAADTFAHEVLKLLVERLRRLNESIIVDTSHDFSDMTIQLLNMSDTVLAIVAPEIASLRTTLSAMEIYDRLGIPPENVKLVLNNITSNPAIKQAQLEKVLRRPFDFVLPFEAGEVSRALNFGKPFILSNPDLPICRELEKMAYALSDDTHKAIPPAIPSPTWKRVTSQLAG